MPQIAQAKLATSRILVFGSAKALASPRAQELAKILQGAGISFLWAESPQVLRAIPEFKKSEIPWAILISMGKVPVPLVAWQGFFTEMPRRPQFAAIVDQELPAQYLKELKPTPVVNAGENLDALLGVLMGQNLAGVLANRDQTISKTKVPQAELDSPLAQVVDEKTQVMGLFAQPLSKPAPGHTMPGYQLPNFEGPPQDLNDLALAAEVDHTDAALAVELKSDEKDLDLSNVGSVEEFMSEGTSPLLEAPKGPPPLPKITRSMSGLKPPPMTSLPKVPVIAGDSYISQVKEEPYIDPSGPSLAELPLSGLGSPSQLSQPILVSEPVQNLQVSPSAPQEMALEPMVGEESFTSAPVATSAEEDEPELPLNNDDESAGVFSNFASDASLSGVRIRGGAELSSKDSDTLKKYASIKERDAREKDAAIQVFKNQVQQLQERLAKNETERRRLNLALEETESRARALEDLRDSHKHHLSKLEQQHTDELRALQLRLDNTQFQATRAEKKLEDFRERVRKDILRIRAHERELANKLELQKRDAEALLGAKDERLLQQRRELDRQQYELEILKERMLEETQRAEERASRLVRALKSLKLAQGMLSGMGEEVLPSTFENSPAPLDDEDDLPEAEADGEAKEEGDAA